MFCCHPPSGRSVCQGLCVRVPILTRFYPVIFDRYVGHRSCNTTVCWLASYSATLSNVELNSTESAWAAPTIVDKYILCHQLSPAGGPCGHRHSPIFTNRAMKLCCGRCWADQHQCHVRISGSMQVRPVGRGNLCGRICSLVRMDLAILLCKWALQNNCVYELVHSWQEIVLLKRSVHDCRSFRGG